MIAKKKSRYDLERKRTTLFLAGLLAAGSFTLAAFTYTSEIPSEYRVGVSDNTPYTPIQVLEDPIVEEIPKVQKPKINNPEQSSENQDVGNPNAVSENVSTTENSSDIVLPGIDIPDVGIDNSLVIIDDTDELIKWPKIEAQYVGGFVAMQTHLNSNIRYPEFELQNGEGGKVFVSFIVEKDGSISNIEILRGVSSGIDREAKRLVRSFPRWIPGENEYGPCRTRVRLPINFHPE